MCTIGYFNDNGTIYAGKNREPGKNSLDTLVIKSRYIQRPTLFYIGIDPRQDINLHEEIEIAFEQGRCFDIENDLESKLFFLSENETIPQELSEVLSNNIWGGIYPTKQIGLPSASPVKAIYLIPTSDLTVIGNASHYNLSRIWGGINEKGLVVQSSSIRHNDRLKNRPSYSILTNEILSKCATPEKALEELKKLISNFNNGNSPGAANFLIANSNSQIIVEYVPADLTGNNRHTINIHKNESSDFRTNLALHSKLFMNPNWNLESASEEEREHFIRSINRLLVTSNEVGTNIFSSHTVYDSLFENETLKEIFEIFKRGDILNISLPSSSQFASFYSICTHPVTFKEEFHTYKRTFWNMLTNLSNGKTVLSYDNCCQSGANIIIKHDEINDSLQKFTLLQ